MHFAVIDILMVGIIGLAALGFLAYSAIKMRRNKSVSLCNGCTGGKCSTKNFAGSKEIKIQKSCIH